MTVVLVLMGALACSAAAYLFFRNQRVLRLRLALIRQVSQAVQADIDAGNFDWRWRYDAIDRVSYEAMLLSLKPLRPESYYEDTSFLRAAS